MFTKELKFYIFSAVLSLLLVFSVFKIFDISTSLPFNYSGDALVHYNFAKNIQLTNTWYKNPYLGAPLEQELYDFPLTEYIPILLLSILSKLGLSWIQSVNYLFILGFPLTTLTAHYVFRKLKLSHYESIPLAIIFSFLPYHFYRGVNHLFLSIYLLVPFVTLLCLQLANNHYRNISKPKHYYFLILTAVITASSGAYYTFFSLILTSVAFLIGLAKSNSLEAVGKQVKVFSLFIAITIGFTFINYIPVYKNNLQAGVNLNATQRHPKDTETFGLKISQLILPVEDHNLSILNRVRKHYKTYGLPQLINENQYSSFGVITSISFLLLLLWSLILPNKTKTFLLASSKKCSEGDKDIELLNVLGSLNLVSILYASIGGFSLLVSVYILPAFRSVNRISIFIAYFSLLFFGLVLNRLTSQIKKIYVIYIALFLFMFVAIFDQVSKGVLQNFNLNKDQFINYTEIATQLNNELPYGSKIYTMPFGQYPEGNDKEFMKIALLTDNLFWSAGAMRWRSANTWQYHTSSKPMDSFLYEVATQGFNGLLILPDKLTAEARTLLVQYLGDPKVVSDDRKYEYFSLDQYIMKNSINIDPNNIFYHISGKCINNYSESLVSELQYWCVDDANIVFENTSDSVREINFEVTYETTQGISTYTGSTVVTTRPQKLSLRELLNGDLNTDGVFQKPFGQFFWPSNLGYPNLKILEVKTWN